MAGLSCIDVFVSQIVDKAAETIEPGYRLASVFSEKPLSVGECLAVLSQYLFWLCRTIHKPVVTS